MIRRKPVAPEYTAAQKNYKDLSLRFFNCATEEERVALLDEAKAKLAVAPNEWHKNVLEKIIWAGSSTKLSMLCVMFAYAQNL